VKRVSRPLNSGPRAMAHGPWDRVRGSGGDWLNAQEYAGIMECEL